MKKFLSFITVVCAALAILVGCTTFKNLTPAQINSVAVVLTQTADQGAAYAIQQDARNATYFKLADATIDTFVLGSDLSPAALQSALAKIPGATNQWVALATSATVVAYDVSVQQYVSGNVSTNAAAVAWITAVESGFKQALAQTGNASSLPKVGKPIYPYFVKAGKVDKSAIVAKVKGTKK